MGINGDVTFDHGEGTEKYGAILATSWEKVASNFGDPMRSIWGLSVGIIELSTVDH